MRGIMTSMYLVDELAFVDNKTIDESIKDVVVDVEALQERAETEAFKQEVIIATGSFDYEAHSEERRLAAIGEALSHASVIIDNSVPPVKRGQMITFLDSENSLTALEAAVITFCKLPIPNDYVLALVRVKNRFYVVVHKNDWLRMGENVRSVENDAMDTVTAYLEKKQAAYLTVSSCGYGGTKGLSMSYAANRLWKPITGRKLDPKELTI